MAGAKGEVQTSAMAERSVRVAARLTIYPRSGGGLRRADDDGRPVKADKNCGQIGKKKMKIKRPLGYLYSSEISTHHL